MFVVYIGTIVTAILYGQALGGHGEAPAGFILAITVWLLFTVLFANFAEALAESRSRAQAASLRSMRQTVFAKKLANPAAGASKRETVRVKAEELRKGDVVLVEAHDMIPATARSSKARRRSMRAPSPVNRHPSSVNRAAISLP
jgi:K+-transporting ATPase ATPase B chain